ncbi:Uma2 family endonuclease [Mannheimia haemolytica]|uniref:Uma2 family endonuclease n=1 Tax=Mannheimia haemolytica TaxID=75985 RepID=UPI000385A76C|nr:Uma2 family endonuclease [Mannheimia haemolytica]EPY99608.1 restriction endonuclease [Mannheimia haemolytica D35]MDW1149730.1 Uma2 family endonuclease [Mannheimia haemolytica]MDW1159941.1 Uma2 family endonuclease [Mannheimia haemolytica]NBB67074.1 Uma2 family endonuclease [Mannheimia haemolytica]TRC47049.1 Uma2 family endonuclease [Mannheimia haemolytica]
MSLLPMNEITSLNQLDLQKSYSYADYLLWEFKERVEIIKGKIVAMSPAPTRFHQRISMKMTAKFLEVFDNHQCQIYSAPFDVRFPDENGKVKTVVQPDLCVICDVSKLDERGCVGAPDLVVEILSPGNTKREMKDKYELYQEQGVKEYWIVSPETRTIQIFVLENGKYIGIQPVAEDEPATSVVFPALSFSTEKLFEL